MNNSIVKFAFKDAVSMTEVEETLRLALLAVQSLHGHDRLCLETHVQLDHAGQTCLIDTTAEVGRTLMLIFAGYVRREFGVGSVQMERSVQSAETSIAGAVA